MPSDTGMIVIGVAFVVALLGSGIGAAFLFGRRGASVTAKDQDDDERVNVERLVKELERCLELGDYVTRDADTLAAVLAGQSATVPRPVASAIQQLIKTAKTLTGRLHRMGSDAGISLPDRDSHPVPVPISKPGLEMTRDDELAPAYLAQEDVDQAPQTNKKERLPASPFEDARNFPRSSFRGSAKATIYPRHPGPGREPLQCTVLTRDLSCGGIGIAHSDQLFPKQIVVLNAVGKLLVGEVRWCRRVDESFYVAGCRLVKTNS
jgi:hypothetical protein